MNVRAEVSLEDRSVFALRIKFVRDLFSQTWYQSIDFQSPPPF